MVISINTNEDPKAIAERIVNCKVVEWPAPHEGMEKFAFNNQQINKIIACLAVELATRTFMYGVVEEETDAEEGKIDPLPIPKQIEEEIKEKIKDD